MRPAVWLALSVYVGGASAPAQTRAQPAETAADAAGKAELKSALQKRQLIGQGRLRVWGFDVYEARLWGRPGFAANDFTVQPFELEFAYLRDLKASDIAASSIKEMRRDQAIDDQLASKWSAELRRVIPDIKKGDRVTGIHQPGRGVAFEVNGKPSGEIADAQFAKLFFGIWLAPNTSEPQLRAALLAGAGG